MKANLLSLCADHIVLRTKLFEEGGYDAVIKPVAEPELNQTHCSSRIGSSKDVCAFNGAYRTNHKDSRHQTTWRTFSAHLENSTKWNKSNPRSEEGVIQFTNQVNPILLDSDISGKIGGFRPNQNESSYEPNCSGILTHYRTNEAWNRTKINFGLGDIQFLIQTLLSLPYLESHEFGQLQTYLWRPGDLYNDLGASPKALQCSSTQRIRRILLHFNLPYLDAFTLGGITLQRLFPLECCYVLDLIYTIQNVPKARNYLPKLTRYKCFIMFPYLGRFDHKGLTASFRLAYDLFLV